MATTTEAPAKAEGTTKDKVELRSALAAAVAGNMPADLKPLAERAKGLAKVHIGDSPVAFGVKWEAGDYLDPTDAKVQALAVEAKATGRKRREIALALGFHRPSAYDRALARAAKAKEAEAIEARKAKSA